MEFLTENDKEIVRNVHHPDLFIQDSFKAVSAGMDLTFIVGKPSDPSLVQFLLNPERVMVQAVKFGKPQWTIEEALEWLRENQKDFINGQPVKKYSKEMKSIKGVDIFSAGTWNGDKFTENDLDEMVKAFEANKEAVRPFLKLGHANEQKLLQKEGLPAAGWIDRIYRQGSKLKADFVDIPKKVHDLIMQKAYRKVSSEIMIGVKILDKSYKYMVSAVALLGAETPGVMNLDDILARYGLDSYDSCKAFSDFENDKTVTYEFENEKQEKKIMPTERELELEAKLKAAEAQNKTFSAKQSEQEEALKAEQAQNKENAEKLAEFNAKFARQEIQNQVDKLEAEKQITPAMKPFVTQLLGEDKKEYKFTAADKEQTMSKFEIVKELCKLFSSKEGVNLDEGSVDGEVEGDKVTEDQILAETEKYAQENKVDFSAAYKVVTKKYEAQLAKVQALPDTEV